MLLWIIFVAMTAAAVFAVLWPLGHKPRNARGGSDRLVYQDQLREVDRDRAAGLIGDAEAETARIEISRRLLAAADEEAKAAKTPAQLKASWHRRAAAIAALVIVPAIALGFYHELGSPDVPWQSAFARANPHGNQSIEDIVSQAEAHLARDPNDGTGWEVLAPVYLRMGRYDDAVMARRKAIALLGDTPTRESDLGEALVAAANGVVTAEAKNIFQKSIAADPHDAQGRYFLGLADQQDGNTAGAVAKWQALLKDAPPGAPWVEFVRTEVAHATGAPAVANGSPPNGRTSGEAAASPTAPGPSADDVAAAENMSPEERTAMVRGMVQRLSDRLHSNGSDVEGWLRLVRAYTVLGDRDKAKEAAADARHALSDHPDDVKRIDDLVKGLGLEG